MIKVGQVYRWHTEETNPELFTISKIDITSIYAISSKTNRETLFDHVGSNTLKDWILVKDIIIEKEVVKENVIKSRLQLIIES